MSNQGEIKFSSQDITKIARQREIDPFPRVVQPKKKIQAPKIALSKLGKKQKIIIVILVVVFGLAVVITLFSTIWEKTFTQENASLLDQSWMDELSSFYMASISLSNDEAKIAYDDRIAAESDKYKRYDLTIQYANILLHNWQTDAAAEYLGAIPRNAMNCTNWRLPNYLQAYYSLYLAIGEDATAEAYYEDLIKEENHCDELLQES